MKRFFIVYLLMMCLSPVYAQFATFKPIIPNTKGRGYIPPPVVIPDLPSFKSYKETNDEVSVLNSYRATVKFTGDKDWNDWVYNDIKIILNEGDKYFEFKNKNNLKIYYDSLEYFEDSTNGNKIFVSNNAIDNKGIKVRVTLLISQTTAYINLLYSDIEYFFEIKNI